MYYSHVRHPSILCVFYLFLFSGAQQQRIYINKRMCVTYRDIFCFDEITKGNDDNNGAAAAARPPSHQRRCNIKEFSAEKK